MGQTLPNGIYLPAEGERNCYDGLEGNWRSLDGLISTVAGKASASHSHGSITNDGKVGTTANLPLITGTGGVVQAGSFGTSANTFCEGNDSRLSDARTPVAHTHGKADITDLFNSANTWTGTNTFSLSSLYQKGFSSRASAPASNEFGQFNIVDTNNNPVMSINYANRSTGSRDISLRVYDNAGNANGVGVFKDVSNNYSFCSINPSNTISLGTSDNKWKTLNGVNPGALSLPDSSKYDDVTSQIQPPAGESTINLQGGANTWTASADGYLVYMGRYNHFSQAYLYVIGTYIGAQMSTDSNSSPLYRFISVPVCKNQVVQIQVYGTQFNGAYFYPSLGNV